MFLIENEKVQMIEKLLMMKQPVYLYGPTGVGKTTLLLQLLKKLFPTKRTNELSCYPTMDEYQLFGSKDILPNGATAFTPSTVTIAMKNKEPLLLNELDSLPIAATMALQPILEKRSVCLPLSGEVLHPWEGESSSFFVCATGNTYQGTDRNGLYRGTGRFNQALADRLLPIEIGYPTEEAEKTLLIEKGIPQDIASSMSAFATCTRNEEHSLLSPMSVRKLVQWAEVTKIFGAKESFLSIILPSFLPQERAEVEAIFRFFF